MIKAIQTFLQRHHQHDIFTWHSRLLNTTDSQIQVHMPVAPDQALVTQQVMYIQGAFTNNQLIQEGINKHSRYSKITVLDLVNELLKIEVNQQRIREIVEQEQGVHSIKQYIEQQVLINRNRVKQEIMQIYMTNWQVELKTVLVGNYESESFRQSVQQEIKEKQMDSHYMESHQHGQQYLLNKYDANASINKALEIELKSRMLTQYKYMQDQAYSTETQLVYEVLFMGDTLTQLYWDQVLGHS